MKLLFILDPLASLKSYKDTSLAIMREAAARGHTLYVCEQHNVFLRNEIVKINTVEFRFSEDAKNKNSGWYSLGKNQEFLPKEFDAILMRKDPPFDIGCHR